MQIKLTIDIISIIFNWPAFTIPNFVIKLTEKNTKTTKISPKTKITFEGNICINGRQLHMKYFLEINIYFVKEKEKILKKIQNSKDFVFCVFFAFFSLYSIKSKFK